MTEQLLLLVQLQEITSKQNQHKEQERIRAEKLKNAEQALSSAKNEWDQYRAKKTQLEKRKHEKEMALKIHEDSIGKIKEKGTKLKTNEEYQAHMKEVESAHAKTGEYEEALLLLMDEEDQLKKEGALKEAHVAEATKQLDRDQQEIHAEAERLLASVRSLDEEWTALGGKIEPEVLTPYKNLATLYKGLAVVPISGNICTGCHYSIPPQRIAEVKIGDKILTCTYCHRILYATAQPVRPA